MFPFEKLTVYTKAKAFHKEVLNLLEKMPQIDRVTASQLKRAALSIPLNIAEGAGRFTRPDHRNFYTISRSSVFECVAIFDIMNDGGILEPEEFKKFYHLSDEMSRMLYTMIQLLK